MHIEEKFGQLLSETAKSSIGSVNTALKENIQFLSAVIEVSEVSEVPINLDQPIIESCSKTINDIIQARNNIKLTLSRMNKVKNKSNLSVTNFGCPYGDTRKNNIGLLKDAV